MSKIDHIFGIFCILALTGLGISVAINGWHGGFIGGIVVAVIYASRYLKYLNDKMTERRMKQYLPGPFYDPDILEDDDDDEEETEEAAPAPGKR